MRTLGRAAGWACAALLIGSGCSSTPKGANKLAVGGGPFANAGASANAGQGGKKGSSGHGGSGTGVGALGSTDKCAEGLAHGGHQTPRVVLVVDGSCSMSTDYPSNGMREATSCRQNANGRWAAMVRALVDPQNGVVAQLQDGVEFGLVVFGTQPMCPIPGTPIQPALNNLQAITGALPAVQPGMFTPTGMALDWVYTNMFGSTMVTPDQHPQPQIAILATDGDPNSCGDATTNYQPSIDAVTKGAAAGVKTYVISLADSAGPFHDHLQQLANIGAKEPMGSNAMLYTPASPADLSADLQVLVGGAIGCDLALDGQVVPGGECQGTVTLNGAELKCNDKNGWILSDPRHIRLQGTACDMLKKSADAMLDAHFPCAVYRVM